VDDLRDGDLLWRERMSVSTLVLGTLGVLFGILAAGVGVTQGAPLYVVVGGLLVWFAVAGSLLPVVEARSGGIFVRNVLHETWVPWSAVVAIVPNARVNVILDGGAFVGVWAVQPGGGRLLGGRSRVDVVVERLTESWPPERRQAVHPPVVRRLARGPLVAGVVILALVVAALVLAVAA
jgi:hypothetical protein